MQSRDVLEVADALCLFHRSEALIGTFMFRVHEKEFLCHRVASHPEALCLI